MNGTMCDRERGMGRGDRPFDGAVGNENTVSCDQCHPNASNTYPQTRARFQQQSVRPAALLEMVKGCIRNPLELNTPSADAPRMIALQDLHCL